MLLDGLPGESLYKTAVRDALSDEQLAEVIRLPQRGHGPWSHAELRLASIEDLLKWVIYAIYRSQGGEPKEPAPTPRPGVAVRKRRIGDAQLRHLQRLREEHERLHGTDEVG